MLLFPVISLTNSQNVSQKPLLAKYLAYTDLGTLASYYLRSIFPSASPQFFYESIQSGTISTTQLMPIYTVSSTPISTYIDLPYIYLLEFTRSKGERLIKSSHSYEEFYLELSEFLFNGWNAIRRNRYQISTDVKVLLPKLNSASNSNQQSIDLYTIRLDLVLKYRHMQILLNFDYENSEQTVYDVLLSYQSIYSSLDRIDLGLMLSIGSYSLNEERFEPIVVFEPFVLDIPKNTRLINRLLSVTPKVFFANLIEAAVVTNNSKVDKRILVARKRLKFRDF